jgi:RNAse (barnase) inhibitor barstar
MSRGLMSSPLRSGVYDMADDGALADRLRHVGWHVGSVDLGDARQAVAAIGLELGFPDYYGRNLDALRDSLGDLSRPTALLVRIPTDESRYGVAMLEILTERAESAHDVPFALVRLAAGRSDV